jgi:hypothetical protein
MMSRPRIVPGAPIGCTSGAVPWRRWADADARRLDDVDGVDADVRADLAGHGSVVPHHVGRDDGDDDAAILDASAVALSPGRWRNRRDASGLADGTGGRGMLLCMDRVRNDRVPSGCRAGSDRDAASLSGARHSDRGRWGRTERRRAPVHHAEGASACLLPGSAAARPFVPGGLLDDLGGTACASTSIAAPAVPA